MISDTYIFGFILLLVGAVCLHFLRKWNDKKLDAEEKKTVEAIRNDFSFPNWYWFLICALFYIALLVVSEFNIIGKNFTPTTLFCFIATLIIFEERKKRKKFMFAGVPVNFQQTDAFIGNLVPILLVAVGMIFFLS